MGPDPATRLRENVTELSAMVVTLVWLVGLFSGQWWWLAALLGGYLVFVPLVALLFGDEADKREWWDDTWGEDSQSVDDEPIDGSTRDQARETSPYERYDDLGASDALEGDNRAALERLRERYAAGELTDAQFEHKLERLLETETIEDAEQWARTERSRTDRAPDSKSDQEQDRTPGRDFEYET